MYRASTTRDSPVNTTAEVRGRPPPEDSPRPVTRQVSDLDDLAVGRGDDLAADRPEAGDPQGDVLDRATGRLRHAGDLDADNVAEAVLPLTGDEQPGDDILDKSLQAKPERSPDHAARSDPPP